MREDFICFTDQETKSLSKKLSDLFKITWLITNRGGIQIRVHVISKPLAAGLHCLLPS